MRNLPEKIVTCFLLLFFLPLFGVRGTVAQETSAASQANRITIQSGSGSFVVEGRKGQEEKAITVFYHKPESFDKRSHVLMVIPGAGRNGDDYRDAWVEASEEYGVLILSPSYPEKYYPDYWSYNLAGMTREVTLDLSFTIETHPEEWTLDDVREEIKSSIGMHELVGHAEGHQLVYQLVTLSKAGMLADVDIQGTSELASTNPEKWIFDDFDRIFEKSSRGLELKTETYDLFGHSAGGQILHRLALFHPSSRADNILAANSGWYTVPTFEQEFPYGLKDSGMTEDQLQAAFGTNLVLFLGEEDDADETRGSLRRTSEANEQGGHRLERGKYFFRKAEKIAEERGVGFEWKIEVVPGVGHDYERMSEAAADYLYGGEASE